VSEARLIEGPVLEVAQLGIGAGREADFENAYAEAVQVISAQRGFRRVALCRGVEESSSYLLLVEWDSLEDHTEGFQRSPDFQRWRALVGPFFAGTPVVRHYAPVADAPVATTT
jgi:heme-degrading monooxygenase HmoA